MATPARVFLSYCHQDDRLARRLETALERRGLRVWRDQRSIDGGDRWVEEIEKGVRESQGVVVLVTDQVSSSHWVTYECALAIGAGVPVIPVRATGRRKSGPLSQFQDVPFGAPGETAERVYRGLRKQSRKRSQGRAETPRLLARFQEFNGEVSRIRVKGKKYPSIWMELWVENVPRSTRAVSFEILDLGFPDPKWTVRRSRVQDARPFLTKDMNAWGNVEIWMSGGVPGGEPWSTTTWLYEALARHYRDKKTGRDVRNALHQIKTQ